MQPGTKKFGYLGLIVVLLSLLLMSRTGIAMEDRPLPADGILGVLTASALPKVIVDNKQVQLGAGAQIRNEHNLIVQIPAIKRTDLNILYEKNSQGQIQRIWLLTDAEYERIKSGVKPKLAGTKAPAPTH
jgi:hypothetical protein